MIELPFSLFDRSLMDFLISVCDTSSALARAELVELEKLVFIKLVSGFLDNNDTIWGIAQRYSGLSLQETLQTRQRMRELVDASFSWSGAGGFMPRLIEEISDITLVMSS